MVELHCEYTTLLPYLEEHEEVNYVHPSIQQQAQALTQQAQTDVEKARITFLFVRDLIHHSMDIRSSRVTYTASEVLKHKEGLCFAKSHLLVALLRAQQIPAGFCYQRLMFGEIAEEGYCLHGLIAVYLSSLNKWVRLDPRGNKPGIYADFSIDEEKLAYIPQAAQGEIDYTTIYAQPHPKVLEALKSHTDCFELCEKYLPAAL